MVILLKAIHRFNAKLIKLSMALFTELNLNFLKNFTGTLKTPHS